MAALEQLTPGARVRGLIPGRWVEVVQLSWHGTEAATLTYRDGDGRVGEQLVYRDDDARLKIEVPGAAFAFDGDGVSFRLASEALPWNPNCIEQRFGRIHRIGRTEVCQSAESPARE